MREQVEDQKWTDIGNEALQVSSLCRIDLRTGNNGTTDVFENRQTRARHSGPRA